MAFVHTYLWKAKLGDSAESWLGRVQRPGLRPSRGYRFSPFQTRRPHQPINWRARGSVWSFEHGLCHSEPFVEGIRPVEPPFTPGVCCCEETWT